MPDEIDEKIRKYILNTDFTNKTIRVFVSYSSEDKRLAGYLKSYLENYGLSVFLAHEDIQPTVEWEDEILHNLDGCDVFIPLLTDNFSRSKWTDQESGIALAKNKVIIPLRVSTPPYGFIGKWQALKLDTSNWITFEKSCVDILDVIKEKKHLKESLADCLIKSLQNVPNFSAAEKILDILEKLEPFTKNQINEIFRVAVNDSQVRLCYKGKAKLSEWSSNYSNINPILLRILDKVKDVHWNLTHDELREFFREPTNS